MGKSGTTRKRERSKERKEKKRMSKQGPNPLMEWLQENQTAFYLYFVLFAAVFMVTCVLLSRQSEGANMRIMSINVGAFLLTLLWSIPGFRLLGNLSDSKEVLRFWVHMLPIVATTLTILMVVVFGGQADEVSTNAAAAADPAAVKGL